MRAILIILVFLLSGLGTSAQDASFTATASPNVMQVGDQFNLTFSSNHEISDLELPNLDFAEVLGGPSEGHSQSIYSVNGKVTTSSTFQYTYFLRASKQGNFTIPSITAKIINKPAHSNAVNIQVIAANSQQPANNPVSSAHSVPSEKGSPNSHDVFVRLILDRQNVYLGEQIVATVKLYTKVSISEIQDYKNPDYTGFFTDPIPVPDLNHLQKEVVNGEIYYTGILSKAVIIPQKTGILTINPFNMKVIVQQEVRRRIADPFFEDFDMPDVQQIPVSLMSKAVNVTVRPLPPNAPASYSGAVGSFKLSASLNKNDTKTNDPVTLKFTLSGKGNLKLVNDLNVNVPSDFDKYDPVINTHMDNPFSGTKTFEYLLMPKNAGSYNLPSVEFTYFEPASGKYITTHTQSFTVRVEKGKGDTLMAMNPGVSQEDVKLLNRDIRFIKTKPERWITAMVFWGNSIIYYIVYLWLVLLFILVVALRRKHIRQQSDVVGLRLRKADRYARKRLKKSAALLKQGDNNRFYEVLLGAIWDYLSDKLNIQRSVLSQETARSILQQRAVGEELINELFSLISECEMARYARLTGNMAMEKLYENTVKVIVALQQKLK